MPVLRFPPLRQVHVLAAVICLTLCVRASAAENAAAEEDDSPLHVAMAQMGKAFGPLMRALREPDPARKADYLAWLQTIEARAIEAKALTPASIEELPEAERPAQLTAFRSDLAAVIQTLLELERAILADDFAQAQALAAELRTQRSDAHKKYNPEK